MKHKILIFTLALSALLLSSCSQSMDEDNSDAFFVMNGEKLSINSARLLFFAMEKHVEKENSNLDNRFWDMLITDSGVSYGEYQKEVLFYEEVSNMLALSNLYDTKYTMDNTALKSIYDKAEQFYASMNSSDKEELMLTADNIKEILLLDYKAYEMENNLVSDWKNMISEEMYRVCKVRKCYFITEKDAAEYIKALCDGGDYSVYASETVYLDVSRSDENMDILELNNIMSLKEGEYSPLNYSDNRYYIYVCENVFDKDLSMLRKEELIESSKKSVWKKEVDNYLLTANFSCNREAFESLKLSDGDSYSLRLSELFELLSH